MASASGKGRKEARPESYSYPKWIETPMTPARHEAIVRAARAYADRDPSDPYLYGRTFLYLKRGIVSVDEVMSDARVTAPSE